MASDLLNLLLMPCLTFFYFFLDNLNLNKTTSLILLDLKKPFDTLNHKILLSKLHHYGRRGNANKLFASFFNKQMAICIFESHSIQL